MSSPDPTICDWWDWLQPCGRLVRICWKNRYHISREIESINRDGKIVKKIEKESWPWESVDSAISQSSIDFIGGRFKPCPLEPF